VSGGQVYSNPSLFIFYLSLFFPVDETCTGGISMLTNSASSLTVDNSSSISLFANGTDCYHGTSASLYLLSPLSYLRFSLFLDYCAVRTLNNCSVNALCLNTNDSRLYTCTCKVGFNGNGTLCTSPTHPPTSAGSSLSLSFSIFYIN